MHRTAKTDSDPPAVLNPSGARGSDNAATRGLTAVFGLAAAVFFLLAVIGTIRNYSPVPFSDMWDDYIGFYLQVHAGHWAAWWAQHNEHRIILARLFFWVDIAWFHGNGILSLAVIYVFVMMVGLIFAQIWREQSQGHDLYILFFVEAWIFSWCQKENLTWAFQSQFILAQLLPLAALYFLHLSISRPDKAGMYFWAATLCGVLAIGSMANGVLALPAMALYVATAGRRYWQATFFAVSSVGAIYLYTRHLQGSHFPNAAPTLAGEIFGHPAGFTQFLLLYLGGPFAFLFNRHGFMPDAMRVGELLAAALIVLSVSAFYRNLRQAPRASLPIALLVFIFYVVATAAITAAGRLPLGLREATSSRYQTPALYAWAAALLLFWPAIAKSKRLRNIFPLFLAVFLCFVMLPRQLQALTGQRYMLYQRELAALALELQINDAGRISLLYPWPGIALSIANQARAQHLSIFGFPPLEDANLLLGQQAKIGPMIQCRGFQDAITVIPGAPQYVRVAGWLFNSTPIKATEMVYLINQTNEIVGLGLIGAPRGDVARVIGRSAKYSGFEAYLSTKENGQRISIGSPGNGCELPPVTARF